MSVVPVICDQCGAALRASDDSDFTTCEYCRTTFRIKETRTSEDTFDEVRRQMSALDDAMSMFDESSLRASSGTSSGSHESTFEIVNGVLTKFSCTAANVVIPNGVVEIDNNVFSGISIITSIVIPDTVECIGKPGMPGEGVFEGCVNLKSINIPDSVAYISPRAFFGCKSLIAVDISPEKLRSLGYERVKEFFDFESSPAGSILLNKLGADISSVQSAQHLDAQARPTGTSIETKSNSKQLIWILVAIIVAGVIFVGIMATLPKNNNPSTHTAISANTSALDASFTDNRLTVHYPSSWNLEPGDSKNKTLIYAPGGGLMQVGTALETSTISASSTRAEANAAFSAFYEGIESSGETKLEGTPKRFIKAGALVEIVRVSVSTDTVEYKGYLYTGYNGKHLASVMVAVPADASDEDYRVTKSIVNAVEYSSAL